MSFIILSLLDLLTSLLIYKKTITIQAIQNVIEPNVPECLEANFVFYIEVSSVHDVGLSFHKITDMSVRFFNLLIGSSQKLRAYEDVPSKTKQDKVIVLFLNIFLQKQDGKLKNSQLNKIKEIKWITIHMVC